MNAHSLTSATAGAAMLSPLWLPTLQQVSDVASILLPILGAVWLIVQIDLKLYETLTKKK